MRRKLVVVVVAALWATLGAWLSSACGSGGAVAVVVENISPSTADLGTEITLHGSGFTSTDNDVGFSNPEINFQGSSTAYLNEVASPDGTTLHFTLPEDIGACAMSQLKQNEGCPLIGLPLPTGDSELFVINENGKSNSMTISVSDPRTPQSVP